MRKQWRWLILGLAVLLALVSGTLSRAGADPSVERFLKEMYAVRAQGLVTGKAADGLDRFYDTSTQSGRFALAHEDGRIQYMQAWAPARNLAVVEAETFVTNLRVKRSGDKATVSLISRTRLGYRYNGNPELDQMGVGSWHWLQLVRSGDSWKVQKEFYLDAMGSEWTEPYRPKKASLVPAEEAAVAENVADEAEAVQNVVGELAVPTGGGRLDRQGVVAYAEEYCGAAWGCGNNSDYNERYQSYRNLGGDCANFASQTLVEGGKLKPDWTWRHDKAGSACWVNAQSFVRYMLGSGRATLLAKGTYPKVAGALGKLQPGDIVGYQVKGTITHVSIITGKDHGGVPIVAAHTADRYRNPWDLGWDKGTVYVLLHLRD